MACCRCNRTGRCRNCSCVKMGRQCLGCLPQRLGNCINTVQTQPPQSAPVTSQDPLLHPNSSNGSAADLSPTSTPVISVPETPHTPSTPVSPCSGSQPSTIAAETPHSLPTPSSTFSRLSPLTRVTETPPSQITSHPAPLELPPFTPASEPNFYWGSHNATIFMDSLNAVYSEVVHWTPNYFKVPYGNVGKSFVSELASPLLVVPPWNQLP